jgi:adenine-specific DNA-methyltransferase
VTRVVHMGDGVFRDAVVPTCVVTMRKPHRPRNLVRVITEVEDLPGGRFEATDIRQSRLLAEPHFAFNVHASEAVDEILEAVTASSVRLGTLLDIKEGIKTGDDAVFLSDSSAGPRSRKVLKGRDIDRYVIHPARRYVDYDPDRLSRPQRPEHFEVPEKLLVRRVGDRLVAAYDGAQHYCVHTLYTARPRTEGAYPLKFLLALLNSRLLQFVYRKTNPQKGKVFPEVRIYALNGLPVPTLSTPSHRARADRIAEFADRALEAAASLASAASPRDRDIHDRRLASASEELEAEVYRLFDLSADQVAAVERARRASTSR